MGDEPSPMAAPLSVVLPAPRKVEGYSEEQWETLFALLDAVTPSIAINTEVTDSKNQLRITEAQCLEAYERTKKNVKNAPDYEKFKAYLRSRPVSTPEYAEQIKRVVGHLPKSAQQDLGSLLKHLNTRVGALLITGYRTPVKEQPVHIRESIFQSWDNAWTNTLRRVADIFSTLGKIAFTQHDQLFRELNDYTDFVEDYKPGPAFDYNFMQFPADDKPATVDVDVVIVGSGCGGALPMSAHAANEFLYEGRAPMQSDDGTMGIVAGSNWGGGGTINWSVSLQPQGTAWTASATPWA
ncbi:hypothetical protein O1611_g7878 [Lasiodiplodia mahajangana]|uniref:Uncharacterized protein n=1 Tax=Lasiodiplodia mahajangana TaxID=1108764 RepID=A0ACC2JED0_9PEZI|nr:hypothetical protein O1611_g7878 [Lasiodiplodia mahajangana]